MKIYKYKKCKVLLQFIILFIPCFCSYLRLTLIPINLNNEYTHIESYLKKCSDSSFVTPTNFPYISDPKISIVTPVYNTGRFVLRLLKSIQYQNFRSLEIILIDDFSNDNSVDLIKQYQKDDLRIRLILNKRNRGTFSSRNIGIMKSRGSYFIFPDSDDILLDNSLNYFYNFAFKHNYEFVRFNVYLHYGHAFFETITNKLESKPIYQPELSNYIFYGLGFLLQVDYNICNKIIKREALIRALNKIDYIYLNLYMTCHEDGMLNYLLYRTAASSYFLKKFGYYYIKNNYKHRKSYYNFNNMKFSFIHLMNVFNFSKNTKHEKDMTNELFKRLIYRKRIKDKLFLFTGEFNFFINAIDIFNDNEFFLIKYKKYLNYFKIYFNKILNKKII